MLRLTWRLNKSLSRSLHFLGHDLRFDPSASAISTGEASVGKMALAYTTVVRTYLRRRIHAASRCRVASNEFN